MRVAGYSRTSTRRQDLTGQRRALEGWAVREGHDLTMFEDDATSGRRSDRAGIEQLLASAARGEVDLVALVELSRLGRSISFIHETVETLSKAGIKLVLVQTNTVVDYSTLEGAALIGGLALAAEIEWRLIQERNARGRETIRARGVKVGRKPCDVSEAALAALRDLGMSLRDIGKELNVSASTLSRRLRADSDEAKDSSAPPS